MHRPTSTPSNIDKQLINSFINCAVNIQQHIYREGREEIFRVELDRVIKFRDDFIIFKTTLTIT